MFDILITGGQVLDGTGSSAVMTDVGITGDHIEAVSDLSGASAKKVLPVTGDIVCPGFIDAHSHSDTYLLIEPLAPSKLHQGITTEIVGNCGASAAPWVGEYHIPVDWSNKDYPSGWSSVAEYRALLAAVQPGPNVVPLIGHKAIRVGIVGNASRHVTADELREMVRLLERSLDEGGRGLSSGLIYMPAASATREELTELARVVARYGGVYTTHMRSEGRTLLSAIEETLAIGRESGVRVQVSHLKTAGRRNWGLVDEALESIRTARREGIPVAADRYPYTASCTDLDIILPDWVGEGGREKALARLADASTCARVRAELLESRAPDYWDTVTVGSTSDPANEQFRGMSLPAAAAELGMTPVEAALHLIRTDNLETGAFFFGMSDANMTRILAEPYVMIGSDASLRSTAGPLSHDYPHPRAYGTFPRFIRMALNGMTVSLPDAVRKMTSLPAAQFRLTDRGIIARGKKADVTILDPATVCDVADYAKPHQLARGINHVIVNGVLTLENGCPTGERGGRVL